MRVSVSPVQINWAESSLGGGWEDTVDQVIQYLGISPRDCHSDEMSYTYDWLVYLSDRLEKMPPVTMHIDLGWE